MLRPPDALLIDKLGISRALLSKAARAADEPNALGPAHGIALAQDAIELILRGVADHHHIRLGQHTQFEELIREIGRTTLNGVSLVVPHQPRLTQINRIRVDFKHFGITPNPAQARELVVFAQTAADDICKACFGMSLWDITSLKLVRSTRVRNFLRAALDQKDSGDYQQSCISSGIAFALVFGGVEGRRYRERNRLGARISNCSEGGMLMDSRATSVNQLTSAVKQDFAELVTEVEELQRQMDLIKGGISLAGLSQFEEMLPSITVFRGRISVGGRSSQHTYVKEDADFAFEFALDTIINCQGPEQPSPSWVQQIAEVSVPTAIYAVFPGRRPNAEVIKVADAGTRLYVLRTENLGENFVEVFFEGESCYVAASDIRIQPSTST